MAASCNGLLVRYDHLTVNLCNHYYNASQFWLLCWSNRDESLVRELSCGTIYFESSSAAEPLWSDAMRLAAQGCSGAAHVSFYLRDASYCSLCGFDFIVVAGAWTGSIVHHRARAFHHPSGEHFPLDISRF